MGTITINIDDGTEMQFRELVKQEIGKEKGSLGFAIQEALRLWIENKKETEIAQRQLKFLHEGHHLGKYKFNRDELHERNN